MTSTLPVRRSKRIVDLSASLKVAEDESINRSKYVEESEEEESEEESNEQSDDEYSQRPVSRKRAKPFLSSTKSKKRQQKEPVKKSADFAELRQEFEDNYLFQALNDSETSIVELATGWIEQYKLGKGIAKRDFINLLLNAVGSFTQIEEHDVANNDSASDTIGEIQTFFKRQKIHEFYLISKKPEFRHLKKNFIDFIIQITTVSDEKGLLYENVKLDDNEEGDDAEKSQGHNEDESNIIEDLLVWLSSLSVSSIRALRYISTLCLYTIETTLCKAIKKMSSSLEVFKKQLETESAKKQTKTIKSRIEQINKNIEIYTNQSSILDGFIQDILNTAFIHRFKDIDPSIRTESMSSLGEWMDVYPEFFFKVTYLKYLGWVLSDENNQVRIQVVKTLNKLLKNDSVSIGSGLRQFLERFKGRITEIATFDIDVNVKLNAISLLVEINKRGFLEDKETASIVRLVANQELLDNKSPANKKLLHSLLNFVSTVETERTNEILESAKDVELPFSIDVIKYISLIRIFQETEEGEEKEEQQQRRRTNNDTQSQNIILVTPQLTIIGESLFQSSRYSSNWQDLIKFFTADLSTNAELKKKANRDLFKYLELTAQEKRKIFQMIFGNVKNLVENKDEDSLRIIIKNAKLILNSIENNIQDYSIFIQIFNILNIQDFEFDVNEYNEIVSLVVKFFKDNEINELYLEFTEFFQKLKFTNNENDLVLVKDLISETLIKYVKALDSIRHLESIDAGDEDELYSNLRNDYILKLLTIGKSFDISAALKDYEKIEQAFIDHHKHFNDELVISTFKLLLSSVSWKLNGFANFQQECDAMVGFTPISKILSEFISILTDAGAKTAEDYNEDFRYQTLLVYVDFLRLLKNFFDADFTNVENLDKFQGIELNSFKLHEDVIERIAELFLIKEYNYASLLKVELDRLDEESLDFMKLTSTISSNEQEDNTSDGESEAFQDLLWLHEKKLILLTSKILDLIKLGMLAESFADRLQLNKDELGDIYPLLFEKQQQQEEKEHLAQSVATKSVVIEDNINNGVAEVNQPAETSCLPPDNYGDDEIANDAADDSEVPDIPMDD